MSKYKKGDMFVVEITDTNCVDGLGGFLYCLNGIIYTTREMLDTFTRLEKYNEAYEKGLKDAWETARKIGGAVADGGYSGEQLANIFGSAKYQTVFELSAETAIEKIKAYEEKQNKIRVGDVVEVKESPGEQKVVVTSCCDTADFYCGFCIDSGLTTCFAGKDAKKTGQHLKEVEEIISRERSATLASSPTPLFSVLLKCPELKVPDLLGGDEK